VPLPAPLRRFVEQRFVRSTGPGGQNVNKVATAVELRFDLAAAPLPEAVKTRLRALAGSRINEAGVLVIHARESRSQMRNRERAEERLVKLLDRAAAPRRSRRATRPSAGAKEARLAEKHRRADAKVARRRTPDEGEPGG